MSDPPLKHVDVLVVGAGLSGIGAGYRLQTECPTMTYAIVEGREAIGGTWDLFRYPGIRSDSDMSTLGYPFRPWRGEKAIADGPSILEYIRETAREYGIDEKIRFGHRVEKAEWSSDKARWSVSVRRVSTGEVTRVTCRFLFMCTGYYDYAKGHTPVFPGIERFRGRIAHPQHWTDDIDYEGKSVVVIGSGATAITLVPELSKKAKHVTMLQRSPTYVLSLPAVDYVGRALGKVLPGNVGWDMARVKNIALAQAMFEFCRAYPAASKRLLIGAVKRSLGAGADVDPHFTPRYDPWDQRLCVVPNGDLFKAIKRGRVDVVTDRIETFTESGIELASGASLDADVVVSATGLRVLMLGGAELFVDGRHVDVGKSTSYKGTMLSGVPNFAVAVGYTNASWTLKSDLACLYVCRVLNEMRKKRFRAVTPTLSPEDAGEAPLLDLASGYVQRAADLLPRQGTKAPWKVYQNYFIDFFGLRFGSVKDHSLVFAR